MTEKPVPPGKPRTVHGLGMDAASTANFQALGRKTAPATASASQKPPAAAPVKTTGGGKGK